MIAKIIAQYVKEMRKKYKLTQVDLSEKARGSATLCARIRAGQDHASS